MLIDQYLIDGQYICPYCKSTYSKMGIFTHIQRCKLNPDYVKRTSFNKSMVTDEMREKRRQASLGSDSGKFLKPYHGLPHTEDSRAKIAQAMIGNTNGSGRGTRIEAFGYTFKSTWELAVAEYLNRMGYLWTYETFSFLLTMNSAYTPDFIIYNEYGVPYRVIEVKGYFWPASLEKFQLFLNLYPQFQTELWTKDVLKGLNLI